MFNVWKFVSVTSVNSVRKGFSTDACRILGSLACTQQVGTDGQKNLLVIKDSKILSLQGGRYILDQQKNTATKK